MKPVQLLPATIGGQPAMYVLLLGQDGCNVRTHYTLVAMHVINYLRMVFLGNFPSTIAVYVSVDWKHFACQLL
jgi:hypothetical protein